MYSTDQIYCVNKHFAAYLGKQIPPLENPEVESNESFKLTRAPAPTTRRCCWALASWERSSAWGSADPSCPAHAGPGPVAVLLRPGAVVNNHTNKRKVLRQPRLSHVFHLAAGVRTPLGLRFLRFVAPMRCFTELHDDFPRGPSQWDSLSHRIIKVCPHQ